MSDSVSYRLEVKVNLGNYETVGVSFGYTSDLKADETPQQAYERAKAFVEEKMSEKYREIKEKK